MRTIQECSKLCVRVSIKSKFITFEMFSKAKKSDVQNASSLAVLVGIS